MYVAFVFVCQCVCVCVCVWFFNLSCVSVGNAFKLCRYALLMKYVCYKAIVYVNLCIL